MLPSSSSMKRGIAACVRHQCLVLYAVFVCTVVPLFAVSTAFPQVSETSAKKDSLYSRALFASIAEMEKSWGHIDDSDGGERVGTDYRHMLVEKDPEITDGLPSQVGDHRVEYLDKQALVAKYKQLRKEFAVLRIHPVQNAGTELKIEVSVSYFKYRRGKTIFAVSDWSDVKFRYDCEKQTYVVTAVALGGI